MLAPFRFAHDEPRADTPPRPIGADTDAVLRELGYGAAEVERLRARGVVWHVALNCAGNPQFAVMDRIYKINKI